MFARTLQPVAQAIPQDDLEREEDLLVAVDGASTGGGAPRLWWARGIAAVALVGTVLVVFSHSDASDSAPARPEAATSLAESSCAWPGQNCKTSGCCQAGGKTGFQCFEKNLFWGECLEGTCEPGVHEGEKEGTYAADGTFKPQEWSCKEIGDRSERDPCSAPGEDCSSSRCCAPAFGGNGMTCFEKDETWASCRDSCVGEADWTCQALGERTPFPANCAWAGDSCADTHLCCNVGFVCAVKDDTWTACAQTQQKTTWMTKNIPLPADWKGTIVGGGRNEYQVGPAGDGEQVSGTTLYCFMAYLPDSYEVGLYWEAFNTKSSIFACDGYDSFHSWQSTKAGWDTGEATLSNTDVFINVWDNMINQSTYLKYDWTVKVDADAVLIPDRLRSHLAGLRPPAYRPIYIKNNAMDPGMGNSGFLGAVEVFSKQAVQIYADNKAGCRKSLGINAGEDGYFKGCMDALGIGFMVDAQLFNPDKSAGACNNGGRAAFHPLKTPKEWRCCLDISNGINHKVDYGVCDMVYPVPTEAPAVAPVAP